MAMSERLFTASPLSVVLAACLLVCPLLFHPAYYLPFEQAKWVFTLGAAGVVLMVLVSGASLLVPRLQILQNLCLLGFAGVGTYHVVVNGYENQEFILASRLTFLVYIVGFYNLLTRHRQASWGVVLVLVVPAVVITLLGLGAIWQVATPWFPVGLDGAGRASLFGNPNKTAEFLSYVLIFICAFYQWFRQSSPSRVWLVDALILGPILAYIVTLGSRAALLSLALFLVFLWYRRQGLPLATVLRVLVSGAVVYNVPYFLATTTKDSLAELTYKGFGSAGRWDVFLSSLQTFFANPWGYGPGNFTFAHVRASANLGLLEEFNLWEHPHNELLRLLVEDGAIATICIVVLVTSLVATAVRRAPQNLSQEEVTLMTGAGILVGVRCMFSFPLQMPQNMLILGFLVALLIKAAGCRPLRLPRRPLTLCVLGPIGFAAASFMVLVAAKVDDTQKALQQRPVVGAWAQSACRSFPTSWRICLIAVDFYLREGNTAAAAAIVDKYLAVAPDHYPMWLKLASIQQQRRQFSAACATVSRYDELFRGLSTQHPMRSACLLHQPCGDEASCSKT